MPVFMSQFSYATETWKQLADNPEDRRDAIEPLLESLGGRLIAVYYAFGDYDGVCHLRSARRRHRGGCGHCRHCAGARQDGQDDAAAHGG